MRPFLPKTLQSNKGLTLLEVLVALALGALLLGSVNVAFNTSRDKIDGVLESYERAVRYSQHETILKGAKLRLHFNLDKDPQEFSLEIGPGGDFVIPIFEDLGDNNKLSMAEQEKRDKIIKKLNSQFNKVMEFSDKPQELPDDVKILGIGTTLREGLIQDGEASYYIYASGEKDAGIIILGTPNEVVSLTLEPFVDKFVREYRALEAEDEEMAIDEQENIAKEMYENWLKGDSVEELTKK